MESSAEGGKDQRWEKFFLLKRKTNNFYCTLSGGKTAINEVKKFSVIRVF
jgi:hypothetical protein